MKTIKIIQEIKKEISSLKKSGKKIAFVPTMGALHEGHLALVSKAKEVADIVIVSIFVNKAQFNDLNDYKNYPKTLETDLEKLENLNVDFVFAPDSNEIYNDDLAFKIEVKKYADVLCGATRPGHFDGVALIITKLFNIIKPDIAIFGQKDFQQVLIVKKLVRDFNFDVEILSHDTMREKSGLAMSSRNSRLNEKQKETAANIYKILNEIKNEINAGKNLENILKINNEKLLEIGFEKIDYLEIREQENLKLIHDSKNIKNARIFIAAFLNNVRLIDNLKI